MRKERRVGYKLLAADLDDTLVGEDMIFSPRVKAAIRGAIERGVLVTLATGRTFRSVLPMAQELGIKAPLISYQGGLIKDLSSGEVLYERVIPLPLAQEFVRFVQERGLQLNVYLDDNTYTERIRSEAELYFQLSGVPIHTVGDLLSFLDRDPAKFMVISSDAATADRLVSQLKERFDGQLEITKSYPTFIEGIPLGVSKGKALAYLADHLGIAQEETMAIGDQDNDADMVAWAGLGVAVGNATQAVMAAADYVAPPIWEDGAAEAIERFILEAKRV